MGNEVEAALYLAGTSLIIATHGHVEAREWGTAVTEPSLTSPHGAVSEPHAHALAHLGDLAPLGVCFLEQALQLASSLDTLSSGAEQECKVSFCFLPTICFQTVLSGCTENFPKLTQNTEHRKGEWVDPNTRGTEMAPASCQQACLCHAASGQACIFPIRVSQEQGPRCSSLSTSPWTISSIL